MKIKELIEVLSKLDQDKEIILRSHDSSVDSVGEETGILHLLEGYFVTRDEGYGEHVLGHFVDVPTAHRVCDDGQVYLDLTSPHIFPCYYLRGERNFYNPPEKLVLEIHREVNEMVIKPK